MIRMDRQCLLSQLANGRATVPSVETKSRRATEEGRGENRYRYVGVGETDRQIDRETERESEKI